MVLWKCSVLWNYTSRTGTFGSLFGSGFYAHGASVIDYTNKGYKVVEFGENSVINRELRNDINMNKMLILKAYGETFNSSVDIPTYVDSYNFIPKV